MMTMINLTRRNFLVMASATAFIEVERFMPPHLRSFGLITNTLEGDLYGFTKTDDFLNAAYTRGEKLTPIECAYYGKGIT